MQVTTDRAPVYPRIRDELAPAAHPVVQRHANNPIEADHGGLKGWRRPMRGLQRLRSTAVIAAGRAFVQNVRRGHDELAVDLPPKDRLPVAFAEVALAV